MIDNFEYGSICLGDLLPEQTLSQLFSRIVIRGITMDSRQLKPGYLFVALQGSQVDGKTFIPQAEARGAVAVMVDASESLNDVSLSIPIVAVENLATRLSWIAGNFYGHPSRFMSVIAVTGTNGKTTCAHLLAQAYSLLGKRSGILGTMGYGLLKKTDNHVQVDLQDTGMTTPDAITVQRICAQLLADGCETLAMEVSSHALAQGRVADLAIKAAVFTNLTHDHLDYHGDMASYGEAKLKLFSMPSVNLAIVNQDDPFARQVIGRLDHQCALITYSLENTKSISTRASAHFALNKIDLSTAGARAELLSPEGVFQIETPLVGRFNLSNLLAVIASLYGQKQSIHSIVHHLSELKPVVGRMQPIPNRLGIQVIIDFAHTPDALKNTLAALKPHAGGELWCVFGCGGDRDRSKRPEMARVAESYADRVVVTSDNPRKESIAQIFSDIQVGLQTSIKPIADRHQAIEYAITSAKAGDIVLIAGKGHEDYQLIGDKKIPFSDQKHAQLVLRKQEEKRSHA